MKSKRLGRAVIATVLMVCGSGCAMEPGVAVWPGYDGVATVRVSGVGQHARVAHPGLFDLDVSGAGQTVRVPAGNAIRTLRVSGANHGITVAAGASVQSIRLSGVGSTIHLPKDVHPSVSGSGIDGHIVSDAETADSQVNPP
ncbi:hypothetical protein [Methylococcus sp. EFPC2]|uniref:hypothetical protein n=1 Tax=Methylococcus sp. EFPC2 TaxID=2812648 RepID=UPI0019674DD5|nr:hypothetical protein [Methylococcus sp. EFPC2]QSA97892.1 hypothetical protein JWZ97_03425 [Methylococcus sp. EFPC2]